MIAATQRTINQNGPFTRSMNRFPFDAKIQGIPKKNPKTLLHYVSNPCKNPVFNETFKKEVKALAINKCLNQIDSDGRTLFFYFKNHPELALFLTTFYNPDLTIRDRWNKTAAQTVEHEEIRKIFAAAEKKQILRRIERAEVKFFNASRLKKMNGSPTASDFIHNRQTTTKKVDTVEINASPEISRRSLIATEIESITVPMNKLSLPRDIKQKKMLEELGWKKFNSEWIKLGKHRIYWQGNPSLDHLGNGKLCGAKKYSDILIELQAITENKIEKQKILFSWILENQGKPIEEEDLVGMGIKLPMKTQEKKKKIMFLNRFIYLICVKEITRRQSQQDSNLVGFAEAYFLTTFMLAKGDFSLDRVFGQNADLGLPTGCNLSSDRGKEEVQIKLINLIALYNSKYPEKKFSTELVHKHLQQAFGGINESPGKKYKDSPLQLSKRTVNQSGQCTLIGKKLDFKENENIFFFSPKSNDKKLETAEKTTEDKMEESTFETFNI